MPVKKKVNLTYSYRPRLYRQPPITYRGVKIYVGEITSNAGTHRVGVAAKDVKNMVKNSEAEWV